jgi:hypothetical protein
MKTIREWFNELPEPERGEAIRNTTLYTLDTPTRFMTRAILSAFIWDETSQGGEYWHKIYRREQAKECC